MEACHDIALAAYPLHIVGRCAFECGIEQRLAEAADLNHYGQTAFYGHGSQAYTQLPGDLRVKARQLQCALLQHYFLQILAQSHIASFLSDLLTCSYDSGLSSTTRLRCGTMPSRS